jgi:DNA-binding sugar fermentation-stimulating protein
MEEPIYTLSQLYKAIILSRPSKICKSPYLADIKVFDDDENIIEENVMAHSPALGCCGLIAQNIYVLCTKSNSIKNKSKYVIYNIIQEDTSIIGVNPMIANPIVKSLLLKNKIEEFQNITLLQSEITIDESRFDFTFFNENGQKVFLEVKNVPLADVVDVSLKERKKMDLSNYDMTKKIAIFPDGYRKNKDEPISVRALKHVNHLTSIHKENPDIICALVFLIQRTDVVSFKPSSLDPIYQKAVYSALENGVKILPICVKWINNNCYFVKKIDLLLND